MTADGSLSGAGRLLLNAAGKCIAASADEGTSAWNMDRPGLTAAMDLVRGHGCEILIADALSVLSRRASDMESILADADAAGVTVYAEPFSSPDATSRAAVGILYGTL